MAVLASKIAADAAEILFDPNFVRITREKYLKFLNAGQNEIAILKPDVSIGNISRQLSEGTKQSILSTSISFIKLTRNMGADGETPGLPIHLVDMQDFSVQNPGWHSDTPSAIVQVYMFDEKDPKHFYNYPPQPSTSQGYVEEVDCVTPTAIATIEDAITIDDIYENVLFDYIVYRALLINAKQSPTAASKAIGHWNMFVQAIGRKDLVEKFNSPSMIKRIENGN